MFMMTKSIEEKNYQLKLRLKLNEVTIDDDEKAIEFKEELFNVELISVELKEKNLVLDAISKSYLQIKNKIYFYQVEEKNKNTFQKYVFDLEKEDEPVTEGKIVEIKEAQSIIGVLFIDHDIQAECETNCKCFKCMSKNDKDIKEEELREKNWICVAY
jgi:hypothetical protein